MLASMRARPPFFAELICDNGYKLLLGLGASEGCVQFSSTEGDPPYLMAVADNAEAAIGDVEFLMGDTVTPVSRRYCLPYDVVADIAVVFVDTGNPKSDVHWEAI